ncbi:hypothetical protein GmHk_11G033008 [Glycine max]|nr:hypothetical protein GmHk_11G033008 [Glycine max]
MDEKTKKRLEEAAQSGSTEGVIDHASPIRCHVKWKMARTKKTGQMTFEAAKEITEKIDVLTAAIRRLEHPCRVRAAGAGVTIKQYFRSAPQTSRSSSSMNPEDLQQLTQQLRDQLEESITKKVTRQLMTSFSQIQSQFQSQMQSQRLALPPEPEVGPSSARVSTKESCVARSGNDPETVKVGVEEVKDAEALVPVPTDEVTSVGQTLNTFLAWPTHLVKRLSEQETVSPVKPPKSPDHDVDDLLYLMTLTLPQLFLKPLQVMWDATMHLTKTSLRVGNSDVYGFLEPQSIQRSKQSQFESEIYIKSWMQSSKQDVYLGAYFNGGHWQMVIILPKENLVVWFCSLHNRPDNYLKGIINSSLKGLDDTPQSKSKAAARWIVVKCNRQKRSTECGYYVMHWLSTIILGSFRNNWETYFNEVRPLEVERFKALCIQWAQYYLKVRNQT